MPTLERETVPLFGNHLVYHGEIRGSCRCIQTQSGRREWPSVGQKSVAGCLTQTGPTVYRGATNRRLCVSNWCIVEVSKGRCWGELRKSGMLRLTHLEGRWRRSCCAIVVFFAVTGLAVRVATRYGSPQSSSYSARTTLHQHSLPEQGRQRLTQNAANWMPQVVRSGVLEAPTSYPRIAPAGFPIPSVLLETSLYNRPPPFC
jgi:hypothetical protein